MKLKDRLKIAFQVAWEMSWYNPIVYIVAIYIALTEKEKFTNEKKDINI